MIPDINLDSLIRGRVDPYIYAFETNTVPNFLKVGDTYRPVEVRLDEWRKVYADLKKQYEHVAKVDEKTYFRDYAVHDFLIRSGFKRIEKGDAPEALYLSNEFFKNAKKENVEEAIADIQKSFDNRENRYSFYDVEENLPLADFDFPRDADWKPRENQQAVIDNFSKAVKNGRTNLLMFAVMRFGKSFTSLCCAKAMNARLVVVVCGKTAVRAEWKENVQRPKMLDGFFFADTEAMKRNPAIVSEKLSEGNTVVVFLTMQDLLGEEIKKRHKDLFSLNERGKIDLLIIDETHFGARAEEFGKVLGTAERKKGYDESFDELENCIKVFSPRVKLHLSGTPYRILLDNEFENDDIVGMVQYSDIIGAKEKWDADNIDKDEWENPYYGFPEMIRFAFNLSEGARTKLSGLKNNGYAYDLSELFSPISTSKDSAGHKEFKYKNEVLDLLRAIDGSKADENIFAFLNYEKIKKGSMCRHIVMVLPFCASCDAMENLLRSEKFNNLNDYEIINIAGFDADKSFSKSDYASRVKEKIEKAEAAGKKTISLTVGKMLTGCTVKEWDTMIFLRNTQSPQDYDQAVFRLQSQYVKTIANSVIEPVEMSSSEKMVVSRASTTADNHRIIKRDMKPQTILVDFDPVRMYTLQHKKSLIANINKSERGNEILAEKLKRELEIAPIICMNRSKLQQVEAADIVDSIRAYNAGKSMLDETFDIEIDSRIFADDAIKSILQRQPEVTGKGIKFEVSPYNSDENADDLETPEVSATEVLPEQGSGNTNQEEKSKSDDENKNLATRLQGYYFKLLLFAFLSEKEVKTVSDIVREIETAEDGKRIGKNLAIDVADLRLVRGKINPQILSILENKIQNINQLGKEIAAEKIGVALRKMSRLSVSEVVTPDKVAAELVGSLPEEITAESKILDIASKTGEFAAALLARYGEGMKDKIYSIPTSSVTYECTRKIYKLLGFPIEHIYDKFTSYDLIDKTKNKTLLKELRDMNFDAIIGNPPYQAETENTHSKNGQNPRTNIFQHFETFALENSVKSSALIFPAVRWIHRSGKGLKDFGYKMINDRRLKKLVFFPDATELFDDTEIADGISIVVTETSKNSSIFEFEYRKKDILERLMLNSPNEELLILNPKDNSIVNKIKQFVNNQNLKYLHEGIFSRTLFGIESDFIEKNSDKARIYNDGDKIDYDNEIKLLTNDKAGSAGRSRWFVVNKNTIKQNHDFIEKWQVVVSSAHGGGQEGRDNQIAIIDNYSAFGRSKVALKSFDTKEEAQNFFKYANSVFVRYAFLMSDEALSSLGMFVPDLLDYTYRNPIVDFTKNIDVQILELLGISKSEFEYMVSLVGDKNLEEKTA